MGGGYSFRVAAVAAAGWVLALFARSDNLHSLAESTSYDRLMLGARLWHDGVAGIDANFPLGSAVLYAIPQALGLPPVAFGRGLSLLFAVAAAAVILRVVRELDPRESTAAAALVALVCVPGLVRGAVVVGEEAAFTLALAGAALGLMKGRWGWAIVAANAAPLVRLEAMGVVPLIAVGVALVAGGRRGLAGAVACFGSTALHLVVSALGHSGDPIGFARVASDEVGRNAAQFGGELGAGVLPRAAADQLAGPAGGVVLLVALVGVVALVRRREWIPAAAAGYLLVFDQVLTSIGALEPRSPRMLAPLLVFLIVAAVALPGRDGRRWTTAGIVLLIVGFGVPRAWVQAREERLPPGLVEAARSLGERPLDEYVVTTEQHPVVIIESGRPPSSVGPAHNPAREPAWRLEVSDEGVVLRDLRGGR